MNPNQSKTGKGIPQIHGALEQQDLH
jgi:hypothetical protein